MLHRAAFIERFVLPLVAGGEVHVGAPLGFGGLGRLLAEEGDSEAERALSSARWRVAEGCVVHPEPPPLDEDSLRLAIAAHDLFFLAHPDAPDAARGEGHRRIAAACVALCGGVAPTGAAAALVARHTLLHQLPLVSRTDVRVSFWAGRRDFRGQRPPARLSAWPRLRRVSEERWQVGTLAEAASDSAGGADAARVLLGASPLTDLLTPLRQSPAFDLGGLLGGRGGDGLALALGDPALCRLVAYRWLEEGIDRTGAAFAAALVRRLGPRSSDDLRFGLLFTAHLHLCLVLGGERTRGEALRAAGRGEAAQRDFVGLFAALHKTAPSRALPADVRADPSLAARVAEHAEACATTCGAARVRELAGLVARTLDGSENLAA